MRELHKLGRNSCILCERDTVTRLPLQERVRQRLKQLVTAKGVSHAVLAKFLGVSRSHVTRMLNEDGAILLTHVEKSCEFFQITPAEFMIEPETLIQPIQPIEAALLALFRQMTELERRSLLTILERPVYTQAPHAKKSRLGRAMLTVKEQELVDLYARVKRDGVREGILKTLRAVVREDAGQTKPRTTG